LTHGEGGVAVSTAGSCREPNPIFHLKTVINVSCVFQVTSCAIQMGSLMHRFTIRSLVDLQGCSNPNGSHSIELEIETRLLLKIHKKTCGLTDNMCKIFPKCSVAPPNWYGQLMISQSASWRVWLYPTPLPMWVMWVTWGFLQLTVVPAAS
jgi:hypothetical protein